MTSSRSHRVDFSPPWGGKEGGEEEEGGEDDDPAREDMIPDSREAALAMVSTYWIIWNHSEEYRVAARRERSAGRTGERFFREDEDEDDDEVVVVVLDEEDEDVS